MNKINSMMAVALLAFTFTACKKDDKEPEIVVPVSDGSTMTLNGLIASETGSAAGNSVYVDFSADKQTSVARASWDLAFYSGSDFRVALNNTSSAGAKVLSATSLTAVGETDTVGLTLAFNQMAPLATDFAFYDNINGNIASTVIPAVSATATENKVVILNRGTGGGIGSRSWIKLLVSRNTSGGYTVQYGTIKQTTGFKSVDVSKDAGFNFKFLSLTSGATVNVEPAKSSWDIVWGYSVYQTSFGGVTVPYNFSDLVFLNTLGGVTAAQISTTTKTYAAYAEADVANTTFSSARDVIGSNWRVTSVTATSGPIGVNANVFYVVKDGSGNVYKLKFNSFISNDGGTRGKPVIEYKLVKKA
ncbi:HmuY family protein [Pedobacter nanyangensis]|uniref:HmuY family protein n=1 Tax=Pedobacter nanyangensis TaxID=1562389 RepID=UPI000DE32412|nr:HmuY family protein [Pedobacter nanyangensis]